MYVLIIIWEQIKGSILYFNHLILALFKICITIGLIKKKMSNNIVINLKTIVTTYN